MSNAIVDRQEKSAASSHILVGIVSAVFLAAWIGVFWWLLRWPFIAIAGPFLLLMALGLTGGLKREIATGVIGIILLFAYLGVLVWWIKSIPLSVIIGLSLVIMLYDFLQTMRHGEDGAPR